jgi:hypothetical protein
MCMQRTYVLLPDEVDVEKIRYQQSDGTENDRKHHHATMLLLRQWKRLSATALRASVGRGCNWISAVFAWSCVVHKVNSAA